MRPVIAIFAAASAVLVPVAASATSSGSAGAVRPSAAGGLAVGACTPARVASSWQIGRSGAKLRATASLTARLHAGRKVVYALPGGSTVSTVVPPAGFRPQSAPVAVDRAYGFDPPSGSRALAKWRNGYRGYRGTIQSRPCVAHNHGLLHVLSGSSGSSTRAIKSGDWGGYLLKGHDNYNEVYDTQRMPTYGTRCGPNVDTMASTWIGLGGYHHPRLIQEGFDAGRTWTTTNGVRLWYEYLNRKHRNPLVYIGEAHHLKSQIAQYMTYHRGTVTFHWYNETTHFQWSPVTRHNLSGYYDGTTAEIITEWPPNTLALRNFSRIFISGAGARHGSTFRPFFRNPWLRVWLENGGRILESQAKEGPASFYERWRRCT